MEKIVLISILCAFFIGGCSSSADNSDYDTLDADNDGLSNKREARLGTDPNNADSDGDGLEDGDEVKGLVYTLPDGDKIIATDPLNSDTDGDGLTDFEEVNGHEGPDGKIITDPKNPDTGNPRPKGTACIETNEAGSAKNPVNNNSTDIIKQKA